MINKIFSTLITLSLLGTPLFGTLETAIFGAGCFWKVEYTFSKVPGVIDTTVGYSGGDIPNPTYAEVCTGNTGHAEVVKVAFDNKIISYKDLLEVFWEVHDPTQLNRQGYDRGRQYRTVIFYTTSNQYFQATESKERHKADYTQPIVTEIEPAIMFYRAEEYHQKYLEKLGR